MKYEEYKDSGVEWIGEVPSHWDLARLKFISNFINGYAFKSDSFSDDGEFPVIRIGDISNESISYDNIVYVKKNHRLNVCMVRSADILIAMSGATVGKVGLCSSDDYGYINQRVGIVRSRNYKHIWYNLLSPNFLEYIYLMSDGSAQPNISSQGIRNYYVTIPPFIEQQAIASYLDEKCEKINTAIEVQKKKIELLEELKQTVITDAVTKGLNPNAPMKDSGVEWIGEVPEHWNLVRLKFVSNFINGYAFKSDSFSDDGEFPVIRIGDISNEGISYENIVFVKKNDRFNVCMIKNADILIAMSGATVGKVGLCNSDDYGYINQRVGIVRSRYYRLIWYNLLSPNFLEYIYLMSDGSAQPNISSQGIRDYYIAIPPLSEQQSIAAHLDKECEKIATQISKANRRIELLEELKQSIITEAVTGKVKVC